MTARLSPKLSSHLADIQCIVGSGLGTLTGSTFWLLEINDRVRACQWLRNLQAGGALASVEEVRGGGALPEAVAVAFSHAGLQALNVVPAGKYPFPTAFSSGMGSALRAKLLNDGPRAGWQWSDTGRNANCMTAHTLLAHWYVSPPRALVSSLPAFDAQAFSQIRRIDGQRASFRGNGKLYEPFGFRDGMAQPVIQGLRDDGNQARQDAGEYYDDRLVAPGEFILGYRNEYDELAYCPDADDWDAFRPGDPPPGRFALNGSYLAVRQIAQDVARFAALEAQHGTPLVEAMMGRAKTGMPLGWNGNGPVSDSKADAFRFRVQDANGFACPMGSHIRRVNPRDSLGVDVESGVRASKLHRLLRRGRPYLKLADARGPRGEGLFFIACNADLERQFEFVHQRWVRNPRFGNLHREDDPIVGAPVQQKRFTIPGFPRGVEVSFNALTKTVGGGYFFLPGLRALDFIAHRH